MMHNKNESNFVDGSSHSPLFEGVRSGFTANSERKPDLNGSYFARGS